VTFEDRFGGRAALYRAHRPDYPPALFDFIAGAAPGRDLAWDCGTGSGQAAVPLAERFARVVATDASAKQIAAAAPHPRVAYRVAPAEASGLAAASADAVTVAQALHWFDADAFFAEAARVLRPGGVLAVWAYGDPVLEEPALDALVRRFNDETVGAYWPAERALVRDGYRAIRLPFAELPAPTLSIERRWTLAELAGYLRTWSAVAGFAAARGSDPVAALEPALAAWWPTDERRTVRWPLYLRAARAPTS
jgi:SAM-dependent methyltransferase